MFLQNAWPPPSSGRVGRVEMHFWDTSAVVPLCVRQPITPAMRRIIAGDPRVVVWWGTPVEIQSALGRLAREGTLSQPAAVQAANRLATFRKAWHEILPSEKVRSLAEVLPARHRVTAADAFQLAAALIWCGERPRARPFVCLDRNLAVTAQEVGFTVVGT